MNTLIIIPTYNEEQNIEKLIHQIFNILEMQKFAVLVVDDSSKDNTANIIKEMQKTVRFYFTHTSPAKIRKLDKAKHCWGLEEISKKPLVPPRSAGREAI